MKTWKLIRFIINIVLSALVLFLKEVFVEEAALKYFIGGLICYYAFNSILSSFLEHGNKVIEKHEFFHGVVELLFGLTVLCFYEDYETICIIWAVWSILRESLEIEEIVEERHEIVTALLSSVESIVAIIFSVELIITPGEHHAMTHMYLLVVELATAVLFPQLRHLIERNKHGKEKLEEE